VILVTTTLPKMLLSNITSYDFTALHSLLYLARPAAPAHRLVYPPPLFIPFPHSLFTFIQIYPPLP